MDTYVRCSSLVQVFGETLPYCPEDIGSPLFEKILGVSREITVAVLLSRLRQLCKADLVVAEDLREGIRVQMHSLQKQDDLNGAEGQLKSYDKLKDRWVVIVGGVLFNVRAACLRPSTSLIAQVASIYKMIDAIRTPADFEEISNAFRDENFVLLQDKWRSVEALRWQARA